MRSVLTDAAYDEIRKRVEESQGMTATPVDWNIFHIKHKGSQWTVNLQTKSYSCRVFDFDLLPCSHALVAARSGILIYFVVRSRNLDYYVCKHIYFVLQGA